MKSLCAQSTINFGFFFVHFFVLCGLSSVLCFWNLRNDGLAAEYVVFCDKRFYDEQVKQKNWSLVSTPQCATKRV